MFSTLIQGFFLSAAMIIPLGPQNVFVMQQGSKKRFHLMSAALCSISDIILIMAGWAVSISVASCDMGRRCIFAMVRMGSFSAGIISGYCILRYRSSGSTPLAGYCDVICSNLVEPSCLSGYFRCIR